MTRHEIPTKQAGIKVVVVWDNPMQTFFAQVEREPVDKDDDDTMLLWLGTCRREHLVAESMIAPLRPYADIGPDVLAQLRADRAETAERRPTKLQHELLQLLDRVRKP